MALAVSLRASEPPPPILAPSLHDGFTYEHALAPGEVYAFPVEMKAGEYLEVEVDQFGVDPAVVFLDSSGHELGHSDCASLEGIRSEREHFGVLAPRAGHYRIEVRYGSTPEASDAGRFVLRVKALRPPSPDDLARSQGFSLLQTATEMYATQRISDAGRQFDEAAEMLRNQNDRHALGFALFWGGKAKTEAKLTNWKEAALQLTEAESLLAGVPELDLRTQRLTALLGAGQAQIEMENLIDAIGPLRRGLSIAQELEDPQKKAEAEQMLGRALFGQGNETEGLEFLKRGLLDAERISDESLREGQKCILLNSLGSAYRDAERFQEALWAYQGSLNLSIRYRFAKLEPIIRNNLAHLYQSLGENERAARLLESAIDALQKQGDLTRVPRLLTNLGVAYRFLGRLPESRAAFEKAISLSEMNGDRLALGTALTSMAFLQTQNMGDPEKGVELALRSIAISQGLQETEAAAHHALAVSLRRLGKLGPAREELGKALAFSHSGSDRSQESEALLTLARVERDEGHLEAARKQALAAIDAIEQIRPGISGSTLRASLLAQRGPQFELLVDILMELHQKSPNAGYVREAFEVSERLRARTLLDRLALLPLRSTGGLDVALAARQRELSSKIGELQLGLQEAATGTGSESPQARTLRDQLDEAIEEYEEVTQRGGDSAAVDPNVISAAPRLVVEIQTNLLDSKTALLEITLGAERSWEWLVTSRSIQAFELPKREVLEGLARRYYNHLVERNRHPPDETRPQYKARIQAADRGVRETSHELSKLLLPPLKGLPADQTILFATDGALQFIPFGALPLPGSDQPLITRFTPVSITSASASVLLRSEKTKLVERTSLALFAAPAYRNTAGAGGKASHEVAAGTARTATSPTLPSLQWAEREASDISKLLPEAEVFAATGAKASRTTLDSSKLERFRYLHFATHGIVDSERPALSAIVLSLYDEQGRPVDGYLRLVDIQSLRLNADLVTLSACRTALGREIRGEGLLGLARGFMEAGAARVVASLWSVDDRATAQLMSTFYGFLLRDRLPPSLALRRAQLATLQSLRADPKRRSPFFWAAFTLQGEWQ